MKIIHRIGFNSNANHAVSLDAIGIKVPENGLVVFKISESDDSWPKIREWLMGSECLDIVTTEFSVREVLSAEWVVLCPSWHYGYPQPDKDFEYREKTYDLKSYCSQCGLIKSQVAPFRMKGEPKWGRNHILQMNWVFDEYYVIPQIWEKYFKPEKVGARSVLKKNGEELKTVLQLDITEQVEIETEMLIPQVCEKCGRTKYEPFVRGLFPRLKEYPSGKMARTRVYFGSGASSFNKILMHKDLVSVLVRDKIRGVSFWPVQG